MAKSRNCPVVVTLDIETAPIEAYTWGLWEQNVGLDQIKTDWSILSFSAKRLGDKRVFYADTGGRGPKRVRDDSILLGKLWTLLDEADIIVAQNGVAFDIKKINARLLEAGYPPYSPVVVIDTMLAAKRIASFSSNKLAFLSEKLTDTPKFQHKKYPGFSLWLACLKDDPKAWAEMRKYNAIDVIACENLYLKLRPWIPNHPNVAVYSDSSILRCPKCGSPRLRSRGWVRKSGGSYVKYRCGECLGYARGRKVVVKAKGAV